MPASIAIVGMGARGLSVIERVAATTPPGRALTIHVIDPGPLGVGVHREDQTDELLLNTVAGQITMFRAGDPAAVGTCVEGPSMAEWAGVPRDTYLPRRMLGSYLRYAYARLVAAMPSGVRIVEHLTEVRAAVRDDDRTWALSLADGSAVSADFVVLATGHGALLPSGADLAAQEFAQRNAARNPALAYLRSCYPLTDLQGIAGGSRVAVRGMGLAAVDVVIELTEGRGGRFEERGDGDLVYLPSGAEPQIAVWSRHGRAFWPRARNEKAPQDVHHPGALDLTHVHTLRRDGARDFATDYVPLLQAEMRAAADRIDTHASIAHLAGLLEAPAHSEAGDADERARALAAFFAADERRAEAGNMTDPVKAATDAVRDLRNAIREAVEHGGLTPRSHRDFVELYAPLLHVISAGPPALRARQWRALLACGILTLGPTAAAVSLDEDAARFRLQGSDGQTWECDAVVMASVDVFLPERDDAPLTRSLLDGGYGRPYRNGGYHPGGWDIDRAGRLRDAAGDTLGNLCAVGNPTEGPHYFTNMLPAPGLASRITVDAQRVVDAFEEWLVATARGETMTIAEETVA